MTWSKISGSSPTKSLKELKNEVNKLKKAEKNVESYEKLQQEKAKIQQEIKQGGFRMKHKKALSIIGKAEGIMGNIAHQTYSIGKSGYKFSKSKRAKKIAKEIGL
jgi:hypothetical protein